MNKLLVLALLTGSLAASTSALAQSPTTSVEEEPKVEVRTLRNTKIDFTNVYVDGDLQKPAGEIYKARKKVGFRNLIELRSNFRPELATSPAGL